MFKIKNFKLQTWKNHAWKEAYSTANIAGMPGFTFDSIEEIEPVPLYEYERDFNPASREWQTLGSRFWLENTITVENGEIIPHSKGHSEYLSYRQSSGNN